MAFLYGIVHSEATLALITRNSEAWTVIATLVQVTREDLHLLPMANDNNETILVGSHWGIRSVVNSHTSSLALKPTLSVATFHSFPQPKPLLEPSCLDCFAERKAHQDVANFGFSSATPCSLSVGTLLDERIQNRLSVARIHPFQMIILNCSKTTPRDFASLD